MASVQKNLAASAALGVLAREAFLDDPEMHLEFVTKGQLRRWLLERALDLEEEGVRKIILGSIDKDVVIRSADIDVLWVLCKEAYAKYKAEGGEG